MAADSFSFSPFPDPSKTGFMTCRREKRGNDTFWYGYRRIDGKTRKIYIGKDAAVLDPYLLKSLYEVLHSRVREDDLT